MHPKYDTMFTDKKNVANFVTSRKISKVDSPLNQDNKTINNDENVIS